MCCNGFENESQGEFNGFTLNRQAKSKFKQLIQQYQSSGEKFTDNDFPPHKKSLIRDWNENHEDVVDSANSWGNIVWKRPEEIEELMDDHDGKVELFKDSIEPNDIQQRGLGDCYFLSCLSMLAENPNRVRRLFASQTLNEQGIFGVNMTKNGEFVECIVDDYFPT